MVEGQVDGHPPGPGQLQIAAPPHGLRGIEVLIEQGQGERG